MATNHNSTNNPVVSAELDAATDEIKMKSHLKGTDKRREIEDVDFTKIGLYEGNKTYDSSTGRKTKSEYFSDSNKTSLVVDISYTDVLDGGSKLVTIQGDIKWYKNDESVGKTKTTEKEVDAFSRAHVDKSRRGNLIDCIRADADGQAAEGDIDDVFDNYSSEISKFVNSGKKTPFYDAVNTEVDAGINTMLDKVGHGDTTTTLRANILAKMS